MAKTPAENVNPFDQFDHLRKPEPRGNLRAIADTLLQIGQGGLAVTQGIADAAGANNTASKVIGGINNLVASGLSDQAVFEQAENAARSKVAEGQGAMEEFKAGVQNFTETPGAYIAQGAGSVLPFIAAQRIPGLRTQSAKNTVSAGLGAVAGAGIAKGEIYDAVNRAYLDQGYSPEEADRFATEAQAYTGKNKEQIALAGALGGLAGGTGVESIAARLAAKEIGKESAEGVLKKTLKGGAAEAAPEAVQGGQERYAANTALANEGFDVDPWAGVAGQATIEGLAAAPLGAGAGAIDYMAESRARLAKTLASQGDGAITDAALSAVESGAADQVAARDFMDDPRLTIRQDALSTLARTLGSVNINRAENNLTKEGDQYVGQQDAFADVAAAAGGSLDNQPAGSAATGVLESDAGIGAVAGQPDAGNQQDNAAGIPNGQQYSPVTAVDTAANEAATSPVNNLPEPTDAQKEAGNYKVGRVNISGLNVSVENPHGSMRSGRDKDGNEWSRQMTGHYGYIRGVKARARDKEHVDVNVKAGTADTFNGDVFIVNQVDPATGKFDEPKAYIGYASQQEAEAAYRSNYAPDWQGMGGIVQVPMARFKEMLNDEKAFLNPVKLEDTNVQGAGQGQAETAISSASDAVFGDRQRQVQADGKAAPAGQDQISAGISGDERTGSDASGVSPVADTGIQQSAEQPDSLDAEIRPIVESIAKRRAAAQQINKEKAFDTALGIAKRMLSGEQVKPGQLQMAARQLKNDAELFDQVSKLVELAKAPAKAARAERAQSAEVYRSRISQAKTEEELQAIAAEIAKDTKLTDTQAADLDDAVMEAMDALDDSGSNDAEEKLAEQIADEVVAEVEADPSALEPKPGDSENEAYLKEQVNERIEQEDGKQAVADAEGQAEADIADGSKESGEEAGREAEETADVTVDYKGFGRENNSDGSFVLSLGNLRVSVEPTGGGKYQASFRGAKSSPHLQGVQGAVDWADAYKEEAIRTGAMVTASDAEARARESTQEWPEQFNSLPQDVQKAMREILRIRAIYAGNDSGFAALTPDAIMRVYNDRLGNEGADAVNKMVLATVDAEKKRAKEHLENFARRKYQDTFNPSSYIKNFAVIKDSIKSGALDISSEPWAQDFYALFNIDVSKIKPKQTAQGLSALAQEYLTKFNAGVFDPPSPSAAILDKDDRKAQHNAAIAAYNEAAKYFLEHELTAKPPAGKNAEYIDTSNLKDIDPAPIARKVKPAKDFAGMRDAIHQIAGNKDIRYYLNGIHFEGDLAVATDGHRAIAVSGIDTSAIPPKSDAEKSRTVLGRDGQWIDGTFPQWQRIIPEKHVGNPVEVDAKDISDKARGIARAIRFVSKNEFAYGMPVSVNGAVVYVKASYISDLADTFIALGYSKFTMSHDPEGIGPLYAESPDGKVRQVVMPIRDGAKLFVHYAAGSAQIADAKKEENKAALAIRQRQYRLKQAGVDQAQINKAVDEAMNGDFSLMDDLERIHGIAKTVQSSNVSNESSNEITHNGTRIYRAKVGGNLMWAVETAQNKAKREAGERTVGGDSLHDTLDEAKAEADFQAKQDAERAERIAKIEAEEAEVKKAEQERKERNAGLTIAERRANAVLDKATPLPPQAGLGAGTLRDSMEKAVEQGRLIEEAQVEDSAAKKRDQATIEQVRRAGYILGASNENIPLVKKGLEAQSRLKANEYTKPEYRVWSGSDKSGSFYTISKTAYDYAKHLLANKPGNETDFVTKTGEDPDAETITTESAPQSEQVKEQQSAISEYGLPESTAFKQGKGSASGKWIAESNGIVGNMEPTIQEAAASLARFIESDLSRKNAESARQELSRNVADKIKRGEQPNDSELKDLFGLEPLHDYVPLSAFGWFATEYLGVPRNKIHESLGNAGGIRTSDMGAKYKIVYPRRLHEVFAKDEVTKAKEALSAAGVTGKDYTDTVVQVRQGNLTADEVAEAHGQKIEDVGEKMAGARKDMEIAARKEWSDEDLATQPLSKIWPAGDIDAIEDPYVAAWAFASRAEIPSKPRKGYRLAAWVAKVKSLRLINAMALDGFLSKDKIQSKLNNFPALKDFDAKVRLLERLPREQWKRIGKVREYPNAYTYDASGVKIGKPQVTVEIDGRSNSYSGGTIDEAIDGIMERVGIAAPEKRMQFEVRGSGGKFHIYKKGDSKYHKLSEPFADPKDAFAFIKESYDELVAAWDGVKDRENVKKTDMRSKSNKPRTGQDWRKGRDVGAEEFASQFGFRGVEFGLWVKQGKNDKERQGMVNQAYDALMDLASILNIPPRAISLNGSIGLAFGSRGKGWAAAHYEPGNLVINLTKTKGAGNLAHEWFHALDNYFSRMRDGEVSVKRGLNAQKAYRESNYITYRPEPLYVHKTKPMKPMTKADVERYFKLSNNSSLYAIENWEQDKNHPVGVRPEVEAAFADLVKALNESPMRERASAIDGAKENGDGYWSRIIERAARSFENYAIHKMLLNGYQNDYLANVVDIKDFARDEGRYPYLLENEIAPVAEAFDNLFSTIKTKETDKGVAMFSRSRTSAPIFYSQLARGIDSAKFDAAPAAQWKLWLQSNAGKLGIKKDEIQWTGVTDWLDLQPGKVSKADIQAYLDGNGVQVEETELHNDVGRSMREGKESHQAPKYAQYVVPGGENYKELLLTLPVRLDSTKIPTGEVVEDGKNTKYPFAIMVNGVEVNRSRTRSNADDILKDELEYANKKIEKSSSFKSSHFDQPNILAHVRFDERNDADGNRVLFIQELQSDWNADGRKKGFNTNPKDKARHDELRQKWLSDTLTASEGIEFDRLSESGASKIGEVPNAPFVTETKSYLTLAIKRMMRYAAENGFDHVAFINGQQAADLYDLSKQVRSIDWDWHDRKAGRKIVNIRPESGNVMEFAIDKDGIASGISGGRSGYDFDGKHITDIVGKDVGEKILGDEHGRLSGDGLKVGGEGMLHFYNAIVPQVVNDVLKKVGGGKVENVAVSGTKLQTKPTRATIGGKEEWRVWDSSDNVIARFATEKEALDYIKNDGSKSAQLGFTITPDMREKIMSGLPLFGRQFSGSGMAVADVERAVNRIRAGWKNAPEIIVVDNMNDSRIRKAVRDENERQLSQGAQGQPEGFYDARKVYIVASELNSEKDVVRVLFHETLGHAGLRGVYGSELGKILDQVAMMRKKEIDAKAKQYGLDATNKDDRRIAAEEVLAEMAQTNPQIGFVKRAIAAIRNWLRKHVPYFKNLELTDADIIQGYLLPARRFVEIGKQDGSVGELVSAFMRRNRRPSKEQGDSFITAALEYLSRDPDFFQAQASEAKDIYAIGKDIDAGFRIEKLGPSMTREKGADRAWEVFVPNSKHRAGIIMTKGDKVWVDLQYLHAGTDRGSRIYAVAADYAHNNGKVLIGDPAGLSRLAYYRRNENMLSSALKHGTTRHLMPHMAQMNPEGYWTDSADKAFAEQARPLTWVQGDDVNNIKELVYNSYDAAIKNVPEIKDVIYDPESGSFQYVDGRPFTDEDSERIAAELSASSRPYRAGSATLKRAALFNTFLRREGREGGRQLLGSLVDQLQGRGLSPSLRGIMYSRAQQDQTQTPQFKAWFGDSKVVDENGEPLVVYHGSAVAGFSTFSTRGNSKVQDAFFFTPNRIMARSYSGSDTEAQPGDQEDYTSERALGIYSVYLKMENPYEVFFDGANWDGTLQEPYYDLLDDEGWPFESAYTLADAERAVEEGRAAEFREVTDSGTSTDHEVRWAKDNGYDGVIIRDVRDNGPFSGYDEVGDVYVVFKPSQIKSANQNTGDFDPSNPDIRFSRSAAFDSVSGVLGFNAETAGTRAYGDWVSESKIDDLIYTLQDKHVDLKRVQQAIQEESGDIEDGINAYMQEELFHGRSANKTKNFIDDELTPLIDDMRERDVKMADFEEYLWARHAEERNIQIAKVNPDMPDGGSGMTTQEARDYLAGLSRLDRANFEALAKHIDKINAKTRQLLVAYGLESQDTIDAWSGAYSNYVPLMREDMDHPSGLGTGQGYSVRGNASKRATGSNRAVVDIVANIAQQRERTIIRGEKNRVALALLGLAKTNPNRNFWKVDEPPTVKTVVNDLVVTMVDPNYKSRDNVVIARYMNDEGKVIERSVVFNEQNPRALRMAQSIKNLDQDQLGEVLGAAAKVTRYFSSINTQYNPVFGVINLLRDTQGAMLNLSSTPIAGKQADVSKKVMSALKGIYSDIRRRRKGLEPNSQWSNLWEEFQLEGGQTGYRDLFRNARERAEAIEKSLNPDWWMEGAVGKVLTANGYLAAPERVLADNVVKPVFEWLSDYNESMENAVRLAAYKVALDSGISRQQAASIAKNLTVNFNRRGEAGRQIGALYAFFNASVQGTARIAETLSGRAGRRILQGGLLLGVMQAFMLAGFDDDEPPQWERDRNLIIPTGDGTYIKIAMPLGFNALPAFGRIMTEWAMDGFSKPGERMVHIIDMLLDVTNPIGNAGLSLQTIAPTIIDPLAALAENEDWSGRPIAREDFNSLDPTPGFTRSKDSAWAGSMLLAEAINAMTGGTAYKPGAFSPTPDQLDYLIGQLTGGVGRELMKSQQTVTSLVTGDDLPTYKIPLLGRFIGNTEGMAQQGAEFYNNLRELNMHENEIQGRRKAGEDVSEYLQYNPEARLVMLAKHSESLVRKLRKHRRLLKEQGADKEQIVAIDEQITIAMKRFNDAIYRIKNPELG